jgi:hypothetical protein
MDKYKQFHYHQLWGSIDGYIYLGSIRQAEVCSALRQKKMKDILITE